MRKENLDDKFKDNHYRLTNQRAVVLEVMRDNQGKHLSAEEVLYQARKKLPVIGIATVYRALEKLTSMDILYKRMFGDKYRYELCDSARHQHHHIICVYCGNIFEIEEDFLNNLEQHVETQGFKIVDHDLKFYAYCPACQNKSEWE